MTGGVRMALLVLVSAAVAGCGTPARSLRGTAPEGVSFLVVPADAEVVLDGVVQGKASDFPDERPLRATTGVHRLELRAPGYVPYARGIEVTPLPKRIEATLLRRDPLPAGGPNGAGNGTGNANGNGDGKRLP